jgi:hypothetical protein
VATPCPFNVPIPRVVVPFTKVTVPVGTTLPEVATTVAVRLTVCPTVIVVGDAAIEVVVPPFAAVTATTAAVEVEPR